MYARVVRGQVSPEDVERVIHLWQEEVLPSVQGQQGFKSVRLLVDRSASKIMTLGLWETEAAFQATVAWNQSQIAKFTDFFIIPPTVEGYEVVIEA